MAIRIIRDLTCPFCSGIARSYVHYPEKLKYSRGTAMVKKIRDLKCPFCCGTEFVKGRLCSIGTHSASLLIAPLRVKLFDFRENTQSEIRVYCKNCGSLVREYIRNPEYLEP